MKKSFFYFVLLCLTSFLYSHPHMWFDCEFEFAFSNDKLKGVKVIWTFDKFFSSDIIAGYDSNRDGFFDKQETAAVFQNAFSYTSNYYYFTFIRADKERFSPKRIDIKDFTAKQKKGVLIYEFYINLDGYNGREIYLACYDYTFFCDISYTQNCVKFSGTKQKPSYTIIEDKNNPIYYNPLGAADDNRIYKKWAPGLNTYYPKEIKLNLTF